MSPVRCVIHAGAVLGVVAPSWIWYVQVTLAYWGKPPVRKPIRTLPSIRNRPAGKLGPKSWKAPPIGVPSLASHCAENWLFPTDSRASAWPESATTIAAAEAGKR